MHLRTILLSPPLSSSPSPPLYNFVKMAWFREKQSDEHSEKARSADQEREHEKSTMDTTAATSAETIDVKLPQEETNPPPVGFFKMFTFATKTEIILDILALFAAAGAGATQPLMTLIFGNLTNQFVKFGTAVNEQNQNPSQDAAMALRDAAKGFRHEASKDALILVGIGMC